MVMKVRFHVCLRVQGLLKSRNCNYMSLIFFADMSSVLLERRWWRLYQQLRCMTQIQRSLKITITIPQMVTKLILIMLWLMYFDGLDVRILYPRNWCARLESLCLLNMWRYFSINLSSLFPGHANNVYRIFSPQLWLMRVTLVLLLNIFICLLVYLLVCLGVQPMKWERMVACF